MISGAVFQVRYWHNILKLFMLRASRNCYGVRFLNVLRVVPDIKIPARQNTAKNTTKTANAWQRLSDHCLMARSHPSGTCFKLHYNIR